MSNKQCSTCGLTFSQTYNLKRHQTIFQHGVIEPAPFAFKCSVCSDCCFTKKSEFYLHLEQSHDVFIQWEAENFGTVELFKVWKEKFEAEDGNTFILMKGSEPVSTTVSKTIYYTCHRSGYFNSERKDRTRHLKGQGSKKIDGFCPAQITLKIYDNGQCAVKILRNHWGHCGDELAHLTFTPKERMALASKIASKIPFSEILTDIRGSVKNPNELERLHLTMKKDLYNIRAEFKLSAEAVRHESDPLSQITSINITDRDNDGTFHSEKSSLIRTLKNLLEEVDGMTEESLEEVRCLTKLLQPIQPALSALRETSAITLPFKEVGNSKKRKAELQHRFSSTKQKRKNNDKMFGQT